MDTQTWKDIWFATFFIASALFYLIVIIVGIKGAGDVKNMIVRMITEKSLQPTEEAE